MRRLNTTIQKVVSKDIIELGKSSEKVEKDEAKGDLQLDPPRRNGVHIQIKDNLHVTSKVDLLTVMNMGSLTTIRHFFDSW